MSPEDRRPSRLLCWMGLAFLIAGLCAAAYTIYDLLYPNHKVGDMYGLEVVVRLMYFAPGLGLTLLGGALLTSGWRKSRTARAFIGSILIITSSVLLVGMGVWVAHSRYQWGVWNGYPGKPVPELLRLVREENDHVALDAIAMKHDPASLSALDELMRDENVPVNMRIDAAVLLDQWIGKEGEQGEAVLRGVLADCRNEALRLKLEELLQNAEKRKHER